MAIRMLWFLPVGLLTGMGGIKLVRQLTRADGRRNLARALFLLTLTWLPLAAWLLNQIFNFER
jgi:NhaP-type Na+/H+ or K+/H+ antiporter